MEKVHSIFRSIISRRLWLFAGLLALLVGLLSLLLLPTVLVHAASLQRCPVTTMRVGAHEMGSTGPVVVHGGTAGQGCTIRTGGPTTTKGGTQGLTTCTVKDTRGKKTTAICTGSQAGTCTVKEVKGQTTVTCTGSRKHP
jgi:hypothetical protein